MGFGWTDAVTQDQVERLVAEALPVLQDLVANPRVPGLVKPLDVGGVNESGPWLMLDAKGLYVQHGEDFISWKVRVEADAKTVRRFCLTPEGMASVFRKLEA